ncbi:MAG: hypothetical protein ABSC94_22750 [Polyangiaceae bacterium]|jgi:hypothetical protein
MKYVRDHINKCGADFTSRPLFSYLTDSTVPARRRLAFVPSLAHFVMSFADLYRFFLVQSPPRDRYDELSNIHLSEDAHHWKWFLADLSAMDMNTTLQFSDALRLLWSDATIKTRLLTYEICKMSNALTSLQKLVLINCIEVGGRVALRAVAFAGRELEAEAGRKLVYFGSHHVDTEADHTLETRTAIDAMEAVTLTDPERDELCGLVDRAFRHLREFVDEAFHLAVNGGGMGDLSLR